EETNRLTDGHGADLILDAVGATTFEKGLNCVAPFGHIIVYGRAGGPPEPLNVFRLFEKSAKVSGFTLYAVAPVPEVMRRGIEESFRLIAQGKLKLLVGRKFPLAEAAEAHRFMESRQSTGKLVLKSVISPSSSFVKGEDGRDNLSQSRARRRRFPRRTISS